MAPAGRDNDWKKVASGHALTLKLRTAENDWVTVRHAIVEQYAASGPLWVSRIGKEDSALSPVTRRKEGA